MALTEDVYFYLEILISELGSVDAFSTSAWKIMVNRLALKTNVGVPL